MIPALFLSHGSPMIFLDHTPAHDFLTHLSTITGTPKAIVVVSAHWETSGLFVMGTDHPKTIYDFGGFDPRLYQLTYPVSGDPALAERIVTALAAQTISAHIHTTRGLDHGAWIPLSLAFPKADIPVLQISVPKGATPRAMFDLGQALAFLRTENILIIGSGSFTHNLYEFMGQDVAAVPEPWVVAFADWMREHGHELPVHTQRWDVSNPLIYRDDTWGPIFAEMRAKAPVHRIEGTPYGAMWNVINVEAIQHVESLPEVYSSSWERGGITIGDPAWPRVTRPSRYETIGHGAGTGDEFAHAYGSGDEVIRATTKDVGEFALTVAAVEKNHRAVNAGTTPQILQNLASPPGPPLQQKQVKTLPCGLKNQGTGILVSMNMMPLCLQGAHERFNPPKLGVQQGETHSELPPQGYAWNDVERIA